MSKAHGGGLIQVNPDEIATIFNHLQKIITELKKNAEPNIQKLGNLDFYTEGKAMEAMKVYADANKKVLDLSDQYTRASTLVIDILNTMMKADKDIAEQIIAKLEV